MNTLKERLEAFFTPEIFVTLSKKRKMWEAQKEVAAFFRQELMALAEEVDTKRWHSQAALTSMAFHDAAIHNNALAETATLIRSKAAELN